MASYSRDFRPPAPAVRVKIVKPMNRESKELDALIDTGASMSVIPESLVDELNLISETDVRVKAYDGIPKRVNAYYVNVVLENKQFEIIKVVTTKQEYALVGRDMLNEFVLILDGKKEYMRIC